MGQPKGSMVRVTRPKQLVSLHVGIRSLLLETVGPVELWLQEIWHECSRQARDICSHRVYSR